MDGLIIINIFIHLNEKQIYFSELFAKEKPNSAVNAAVWWEVSKLENIEEQHKLLDPLPYIIIQTLN